MPRPPHIEAMKNTLDSLRKTLRQREVELARAEESARFWREAVEFSRKEEADLIRRIHEAEEIESW